MRKKELQEKAEYNSYPAPWEKSVPEKRIRWKEIIITAIAIACAIIGVSIGWMYFSKLNALKIDTDVYVGVNGAVFPYEAPIKLEYDEEAGTTFTKGKTLDFELKGRPVYVSVEELFLSENFSLFDEGANRCLRVPRFSTLKNKDGKTYIKKTIKDSVIPSTFMFDGVATYIFLSDTVVTIGKDVIELPAFSYAHVVYDSTVELFNGKTSQTKVYDQKGISSTATVSKSEIDLNLGILTSKDGARQILPLDPSFLPELF